MQRHYRTMFLSTLFLIALRAVPGGGETITVGPTASGCDQPTLALAFIRAAITPESDDLLFATDHTHTGGTALALIGESPVTLRGVMGCSDHSAFTRTITTTVGDLFEFDATMATIRDLRLVGDTAGRLLTGTNSSLITLQDAQVRAGRADDGGNIHLSAGASLVALAGTEISFGDATFNGGGIYCSGSGVVALGEGSEVRQNRADFNGGGVYVDGCLLNLQSGGVMDVAGLVFGIQDNRAIFNGGGVYATGAAGVVVGGTAARPGSIHRNTANGFGGGLYLTGAGTEAVVTDSEIVDNSALSGGGGGILVTGQAELLMERTLSACDRGVRCSSLDGNAADGIGVDAEGGALLVQGGGAAVVRQTYITGSWAQAAGNVVKVAGGGSHVLLENSVLFDNRDIGTHVVAADGGLAQLAFVSAWGSSDGEATAFALADAGGTVELYSSVVIEGQGHVPGASTVDPLFLPAGAGGSYFVDCVIAHENASSAGAVEVVTDPGLMWIDPASGDPRLRDTSVAIDYCDTLLYAPQDLDIDNEPRGTDVASVADELGPYDLGADEWSPSSTSPEIFTDGFESGDTAGWSSSVP